MAEKKFIILESELNEVFNCLNNKKVYGAKSILKSLEEFKEDFTESKGGEKDD